VEAKIIQSLKQKKPTVAQQTVYSRLLSSRKTAEGLLCDIASIACCLHKLWFHKSISVSEHLTSQAKISRMHVNFALIKLLMTSATFKDKNKKKIKKQRAKNRSVAK